ncbi:hypothetical protein CH274_23880 [Rhodococcus sp. 06-418-5]|uniref:hypothetical protein n=1 Tax=unclassified Rhodococcus (in: high G+C Gram-positive bacteria) TaxID=192944 RepID=UPI000B9AB24B|nr:MULTISPECIES: hypothetical protein [unclassified Rhodococcus (in: high G+C Gram-positive bacteria)]OZC56119.1 hypothetical protein CH276_27570 [Rhodococcus sp. 06-470-2]OZC74152.1 hypothetical protein CH274_23880 [Rhodococcus sp. 06-418-5]OZE54430.1 hypothetical protein CH265_28980 [Rhodococcus sp. 05-2221-1B]
MYHYEQILNEHRQRVARGVQNYERRRVAEERAAEAVVAESDSRESEAMGAVASNDCESDSEIGIGVMSSSR